MQKIKKKVTVYLGRGIAAVLALMLVALPCLSFPAMAAEKVEKTITWDGNYLDPSKIVVPPAEFGITGSFYFVSSVLVEPDDFSWFFLGTSSNEFTFTVVSDFRENGLPFSLGYLFEDPIVICFYEQFTFDGINFIDPGIYFLFVPAEVGTQAEAYVKEFVYLGSPDAPSFAGSVGESISGVLGWVGTVISSIVTPGGALYTLLPLFVVGISIAVIFVVYKIIRAYVWGV